MGVDEVTDVRAALDAAEALYREGKLAESEQAFSKLLPTDARAAALYGLGRISHRAKKLGRAQALFEQSLGVERRSPNALYYLGRTLVDRGSVSKAIPYLEEALAYQANHSPTLRLLASLTGGNTTGSANSGGAVSRPPLSNPGGPAQPASRAAPSPPRAAPSPPPAAQVAGPPWPPNDPQALVGVVTQLKKAAAPWRGRPAAAQLWTFRVAQQDASQGAGPTRMVGVEMRGHDIKGNLENDDWVEISERPKPEGFRPKQLRNLTTNELVKATWRTFL